MKPGGENDFTRHHLIMIGIFVSILVVLEILIGYVFITATSGRIENERRNEFEKSWDRYLNQRKQLHESKLTGYSWWDELAAAVSARNIEFIREDFFMDKSLRREYDVIMLVCGNFDLTLVSVDGRDSINRMGDFSAQETVMLKEFLKIVGEKIRELDETRARRPVVIENPIAWHFLTKFRGETRLLTLSPVCNNSGKPAAAGYMLLGYRLDKITELAGQIIPAKISVSDSKPGSVYGYTEIRGFF